ncbi:MAG: DJ-1/PfpI family protein [Muribaculaceae bacterium]|nr:DJ-1/PfpI family protein [Muribaculaceae bacterium]MDE5594845.1 DJ-1/PfpI family protein [Muribaculaceae bacterium]
MNKSFVFLAEGFEEMEAIIPVDVLRRAGMDVKTVSITDSHNVTGAHGITVKADMTFKQADFEGAEWLIIPGGLPGAENLHAFDALNDLLKVHSSKGKIAAICASPAMVLAPLGLLAGKDATGYPGTEEGLIAGGASVKDERVVALDNIITANGPASALRFALAIVANSLGAQTAQEVGSAMLVYGKPMNFYF